MKRILLVAALLAASVATASAEPLKLSQPTLGYTYFNRSGADASQHDSDLSLCLRESANLQSSDHQVSARATPGQALISGLLFGGYTRSVVLSGVENCMVVRGWRVVRIAEAEGQALAARPAGDIASAIAPWIGAAEPHGEIVRAWNNEAATAATDRFELRPASTTRGSLSIDALDPKASTLNETGDVSQSRGRIDPRWPTANLRADELASVPQDAAIVLFQLRGVSLHNGTSLTFVREGDTEWRLPSTVDHAPDVVSISAGALVANAEGSWFAFALPAGRWRLASMGTLPSVSFCLGSPAFEVATGEVVYAGSFDLSASNIGPDLSLERAQTWLAGQPAAQRLRAAVYTNGWTGACLGNAMYAIEVTGAPFRDGYAYGGALAMADAKSASSAH